MPFTVYVYNQSTGAPLVGSGVYLFTERYNPEPAKNANYIKYTDAYGNAVFDVLGLYGVGVVFPGYTYGDPNQMVPSGWDEVYSAWGAMAFTEGDVYDVPLVEGTPSPPVLPPTDRGILSKAGYLASFSTIFGIILDSFRRRV